MAFKDSWNWYWKLNWNLTFWGMLIGTPLILLFFLGSVIYTKYLEPKPIETKFACQSINKNYRVNGFLYKTKKDAFNDIEKYNVKQIISLGDVSGYYPYINEVIEILRDKDVINLIGNHDRYMEFSPLL